MELLQPHPLEKTVEKAGGLLENTIRKLLANSGKEATWVAEKEIIKDSSRDSNEFVRIAHTIIIEEKKFTVASFALLKWLVLQQMD